MERKINDVEGLSAEQRAQHYEGVSYAGLFEKEEGVVHRSAPVETDGFTELRKQHGSGLFPGEEGGPVPSRRRGW